MLPPLPECEVVELKKWAEQGLAEAHDQEKKATVWWNKASYNALAAFYARVVRLVEERDLDRKEIDRFRARARKAEDALRLMNDQIQAALL